MSHDTETNDEHVASTSKPQGEPVEVNPIQKPPSRSDEQLTEMTDQLKDKRALAIRNELDELASAYERERPTLRALSKKDRKRTKEEYSNAFANIMIEYIRAREEVFKSTVIGDRKAAVAELNALAIPAVARLGDNAADEFYEFMEPFMEKWTARMARTAANKGIDPEYQEILRDIYRTFVKKTAARLRVFLERTIDVDLERGATYRDSH